MILKRLSALVLLTVLISWPVCSYSSDFVFYCAPWKEIKNKKTLKNKEDFSVISNGKLDKKIIKDFFVKVSFQRKKLREVLFFLVAKMI